MSDSTTAAMRRSKEYLIVKGVAAAAPTTAGVPEQTMRNYQKMPLFVDCAPPECTRINRVKDSGEEMLEPKRLLLERSTGKNLPRAWGTWQW
jgi:hypothetical protein